MLIINPVDQRREYTQTVEIEGMPVTLCLSDHALDRIEQYNISQWEVLADLMLAGDRLLSLKNQQEAAILNMESNITTIVIVSSEAGIYLDVSTVMNGLPVHYDHRGRKTVRLSNIDRIIALNGHY